MSLRYRFDLSGPGSAELDLVVEGDKTRLEGPAEVRADLHMIGDTSTFILMLYERLSLDSAITNGTFTAKGDLEMVATFDRWRAMLQSNAITSCAFVVSANRPRPEFGVALGSPSAVICPDGRVLIETTQPVTVVTLLAEEIAQAKRVYPGYLPVRADIYARCWEDVCGADET